MPDSPAQRPAALRVARLPRAAPTPFDLHPGPDELAAIAGELGLGKLRKLSFSGTVQADGAHDWRLDGHLGATITQPCVITLAPVTTRIEEEVSRRFLADPAPIEPDTDEAEMPPDDSAEPLTDVIDPRAVMIEALSLALPLYPRAPGVELGEVVHAKPGKQPLRDRDTKPFAGLADLMGGTATDDSGDDDNDPQDP
ncbi:DUF177 domain-containing protein [Sediminimonas sp.]|uniref:YceD family protein n=1 Tax=Sediminimonas sp. TaxID=2823379 RepID=UPI0025EC43C2|nr:DUF177 domain-containing protein [Sediminimonas sp.]